jgi:hypothetical protein
LEKYRRCDGSPKDRKTNNCRRRVIPEWAHHRPGKAILLQSMFWLALCSPWKYAIAEE